MEYYLAPLEGITNMYYRKYHDKYFNGVSKYFIPFLNPAQCNLSTRDERELKKENNNLSKKVVPQIISKNAKETLWMINKLKNEGYDEINLNFGCPSGTVVAKGKGSGILKDLSVLDSYLNEVFTNSPLPISIKLRLGLKDINEFDKILEVLNKYDIKELIIHPRTQLEKYNGPIHLDVLDSITSKTKFDIIYNGEIKSKEDIIYIQERFPFIKGIMLGRGLISIPDLLEDSKDINKIKDFFNSLYNEYLSIFGWNNTKFYVKEIWALMINYFIVPKDLKKKLFKAEKQTDIESIIKEIFDTCEINIHPENGIKDIY
jgi:tRNA-dihydrouridine synthase